MPVVDLSHSLDVQDPDPNASKILALTGDILTASEQDAAYMRGTGRHLPSMPAFLGKVLLALNGGTKILCVPSPSSSRDILLKSVGDRIAELERVHQLRLDDPNGYDAHLADARAMYPHFTSLEEWARRRYGNVRLDKN